MAADFKDRQQRTVRGASIIADRLVQSDVAEAGIGVLTGGSEVHLVLVDLRNAEIDGKSAEDLLHEVGITINRNSVPNDPRPPMVTSGIRIGTPALATRGFGDNEFAEVGDIIAHAIMPNPDIPALQSRVKKLTDAFPLYEGHESW
jgi:glycine hydroxymethyltransferase